MASDNVLLNGKFDYGTACWTFWANGGGAGSISEENGELKASITNSANEIWEVGFTQMKVPVESGASYAVSFKARANSPCKIICLVQLGKDPWTIYSENDTFDIDSQMKEYSYKFTMEEPDDPAAYFVFHLGGIGQNTVYFDDVRMKKLPD
jgi:hypothetical protein